MSFLLYEASLSSPAHYAFLSDLKLSLAMRRTLAIVLFIRFPMPIISSVETNIPTDPLGSSSPVVDLLLCSPWTNMRIDTPGSGVAPAAREPHEQGVRRHRARDNSLLPAVLQDIHWGECAEVVQGKPF
jgi:hypothetical protein